jgi:hypothetical protein
MANSLRSKVRNAANSPFHAIFALIRNGILCAASFCIGTYLPFQLNSEIQLDIQMDFHGVISNQSSFENLFRMIKWDCQPYFGHTFFFSYTIGNPSVGIASVDRAFLLDEKSTYENDFAFSYLGNELRAMRKRHPKIMFRYFLKHVY